LNKIKGNGIESITKNPWVGEEFYVLNLFIYSILFKISFYVLSSVGKAEIEMISIIE